MLLFQISPSTTLPFACLEIPTRNPPPKHTRNVKEIAKGCSVLFDSVARDSVSAVQALISSTESRNPRHGPCLHAAILKFGLDTNVFVNNSLLDMYTKCGFMEDAELLFDRMPQRTVVSWTSMISGYAHNGLADKAKPLFCRMLENENPNEFTLATLLRVCAKSGDSIFAQQVHSYVVKSGFIFDSFLRNSLIDAYAKSGLLVDTEKLLEMFSCRDVVSWTIVISGYVFHGMMEEALIIFAKMLQHGVLPNEVTVLSLLRACSCSIMNQLRKIQWSHGLVIKMGMCGNDHVMNSLAEMYVVNGYFKEGMQIFSGFCFTGNSHYLRPETMANILQGSGHSKYLNVGKQIHGYLIKHVFFPCTVIENSLIDMYGENELSDSSYRLFARMECKDIVSWNTMIRCLVKNGESDQALVLLQTVHSNREGDISVCPDFITMLESIQACSYSASLQLGQIIHGYMVRVGFISDIFIQNALVDMYGRTGECNSAEKIFTEMPNKDVGSWNSLITAYGINGDGASALKVFCQMMKSDTAQRNAVTYVNILSACVHGGMIIEGLGIFKGMHLDGVEPSMEHFVCIVDLLGRSGRLKEAETLAENMPVMAGSAVWGALLSASALFSNVETAERAAKRLSVLEPDSCTWRVALSNVYASIGKWKSATKLRAEIKGLNDMGKERGWSSIEVGGEVFKFMVNDTRHPESEMIYKVLNKIMEHIKDYTWTL